VLNCVLNDPPGGTAPEFHAPLFAVDVCVVLSLFRHVTLPPTGTLMGFGLNAVDVSKLALTTIVAETFAGGAGEGVGAGVGAGAGAGAGDGGGTGAGGTGAGVGAGAGAGTGAGAGASTDGVVDGASGLDDPHAARAAVKSTIAPSRRIDMNPPLSINRPEESAKTLPRTDHEVTPHFASRAPRDDVSLLITIRRYATRNELGWSGLLLSTPHGSSLAIRRQLHESRRQRGGIGRLPYALLVTRARRLELHESEKAMVPAAGLGAADCVGRVDVHT
jgi:hypothetical protein